MVLMVNSNMKQQALDNAKRFSTLILDRNVITHAYFNNILKTSMFDLLGETFLGPDWMSSSFAINSIVKDYNLFTEKGLYYKEAAINARNPANEANQLEREFIQRAKNDRTLISLTDIQLFDDEPFFVIMRRGQKVQEKCLLCHGDPAEAPSQVVEHYGPERGYNYRLGETVSAISIRIPLASAYQQANLFTIKLSTILTAILLIIFAIQHVVSHKLLFTPINDLQKGASQIAKDPAKLGETLPVPIAYELASMVETFNQLSRNLRHYNESQEDILRSRSAEIYALQQRNEMILNTTSEGVLGLDRSGKIMFINNSAKSMLGLQETDNGQISIFSLLSKGKVQPGRADAAELLRDVLSKSTQISQQETLLIHSSGRSFPIEFSCAPIEGDGEAGAVFSFNDITKRKLTEKEIQDLAFYDQLTKLPNRTLLQDRISQGIAAARRDRKNLALMYIDLDDFKMVNDTLGHAAGDEFLKVIANRLRNGSRQSDTVARMGGDEFIWFGEIVDKDDAALIARKLIESLSRPVRLGSHNFISTVSIGIALYPDHAESGEQLMKASDAAMYTVKQQNKNGFAFHKTGSAS